MCLVICEAGGAGSYLGTSVANCALSIIKKTRTACVCMSVYLCVHVCVKREKNTVKKKEKNSFNFSLVNKMLKHIRPSMEVILKEILLSKIFNLKDMFHFRNFLCLRIQIHSCYSQLQTPTLMQCQFLSNVLKQFRILSSLLTLYMCFKTIRIY